MTENLFKFLRFLKNIGVGEPLRQALERHSQAAHALDAVVKEMLKP